MVNKKILLADDDRDDREMFCESLSAVDANIECKYVINGSELLDSLKANEELPKLIFLDVNMPIMDGWQCLNELKHNSHYTNIPIIMISTSSHKKDIEKAFENGATAYLVKPSNFSTLTRILKTITENIDTDLNACLIRLQHGETGNIFAPYNR